ncbi:MAG TPA: hypothetical protein VGB67_10110, partial [Fibrella sp.]
MNSLAGSNTLQSTIDMSTGAATLNLKGAFTLTNGVGRLLPGTTSTFNYNGTTQQTVQLGSSVSYANLHFNNTSSAILNSAITTAEVNGNLRVQSGTFSNNGYTITGNATKILEVANGAQLMLGGTTGFPTGFGTNTLGATSTVDYYGGAQTVTALNYGHLKLTSSGGVGVTKTMPASALSVAGDFTLWAGGAGTTVAASPGGAMTIGGNVWINSSTTLNAGTHIHNVKGGWNNSGTFNHGNGTINLNGTSAQSIAGTSTSTFWDLTNSNTTAIVTASAAFAVNDALTLNASTQLNMGAFALSGALTTVVGTGTLRTQNTSATPVPTGETWTGTVEYNATTGGQTVVSGTYNNLTISNTSGTNTAGGTLTVNGTFTRNTSSVLNMGTNTLAGTLTTIAGAGTLRTQSTSATAIPTGKTWTGTVEYNSTVAAQTVSAGTYTNLTISNTTASGATATANLAVNTTFTVSASSLFSPSTAAVVISGTG